MAYMFGRLNTRWTARIALLAAVVLMSFVVVQPAHAGPITGELAFFGSFQATGGSSGTDLLNATGIDFAPMGFVAESTGDFLTNGVAAFTPVALVDFTFSPFVGPVNSLWSTGSFSFTLENLTSVTQTATSIALAGTGVVTSTIASLTPAAFNWSFSGDASGGTLQLFSSTSSPSAVPEDGSMISTILTLMMGMGIAALCFRSRGRAQVTA